MTQTNGVADDQMPLRIGAGQFMDPNPEKLRFIKQLGVDDILLNMYRYTPDYPHMPDNEQVPLTGDTVWSLENLIALRERVEAAGLRLNAIENIPISFYDHVMLGGEKRDEQLEAVKQTLRNIGEAGIPMFGYHWSPSGVGRNLETTVRGGASVSGYDLTDATDELTHDRVYSEAELWENYEQFLLEIIPVAEDVGLNCCLHPNDPPVTSRGGIPQLFRNFESFKRAMELVPSDNHGLEFCLGCWSEMGEDLETVIRYFGDQDKLFYVHFRDVVGTVPRFNETFIGEGNYDPVEIFALLDEVGFSGLVIPDHVPHVEGDTDWEHRGRAHAIGYLQGLLSSQNVRSVTE